MTQSVLHPISLPLAYSGITATTQPSPLPSVTSSPTFAPSSPSIPNVTSPPLTFTTTSPPTVTTAAPTPPSPSTSQSPSSASTTKPPSPSVTSSLLTLLSPLLPHLTSSTSMPQPQSLPYQPSSVLTSLALTLPHVTPSASTPSLPFSLRHVIFSIYVTVFFNTSRDVIPFIDVHNTVNPRAVIHCADAIAFNSRDIVSSSDAITNFTSPIYIATSIFSVPNNAIPCLDTDVNFINIFDADYSSNAFVSDTCYAKSIFCYGTLKLNSFKCGYRQCAFC